MVLYLVQSAVLYLVQAGNVLYLVCEAIYHLRDNGEDPGHVGLQFTQYSKILYTVQCVQITVKTK
jgi:hypothetical protein